VALAMMAAVCQPSVRATTSSSPSSTVAATKPPCTQRHRHSRPQRQKQRGREADTYGTTHGTASSEAACWGQQEGHRAPGAALGGSPAGSGGVARVVRGWGAYLLLLASAGAAPRVPAPGIALQVEHHHRAHAADATHGTRSQNNRRSTNPGGPRGLAPHDIVTVRHSWSSHVTKGWAPQNRACVEASCPGREWGRQATAVHASIKWEALHDVVRIKLRHDSAQTNRASTTGLLTARRAPPKDS
jgi:hypothetical protein